MKKSLLILVVTFFALVRLTFADEAADAIQKDRDAIAGTWTIESIEYGGKKSPADPNRPKLTLIMGADGSVKVQREGNTLMEATTQIDPSKTPKTIDVAYTTGAGKGQSVLGIYEIDGDTLRVCNASPGKERPAEFSALLGSEHVLIAYKRQK